MRNYEYTLFMRNNTKWSTVKSFTVRRIERIDNDRDGNDEIAKIIIFL